MPNVTADISNHTFQITRSTKNPGDKFESIQHNLTINATTSSFPLEMRFFHQSWGNPVDGPSLSLQKNGLTLIGLEYVSFEEVSLIERLVNTKTISQISFDYEGNEFPSKPVLELDKRKIGQLILR